MRNAYSFLFVLISFCSCTSALKITTPVLSNEESDYPKPLPIIGKSDFKITNNVIGFYKNGKILFTDKTYTIDPSLLGDQKAQKSNLIHKSVYNKNISITPIIQGKINVYSGKDVIVYRERNSNGMDDKRKRKVDVMFVKKANEPMLMMSPSALEVILGDNEKLVAQLQSFKKEKTLPLDEQMKMVKLYNSIEASTSNNVATVLK